MNPVPMMQLFLKPPLLPARHLFLNLGHISTTNDKSWLQFPALKHPSTRVHTRKAVRQHMAPRQLQSNAKWNWSLINITSADTPDTYTQALLGDNEVWLPDSWHCGREYVLIWALCTSPWGCIINKRLIPSSAVFSVSFCCYHLVVPDWAFIKT